MGPPKHWNVEKTGRPRVSSQRSCYDTFAFMLRTIAPTRGLHSYFSNLFGENAVVRCYVVRNAKLLSKKLDSPPKIKNMDTNTCKSHTSTIQAVSHRLPIPCPHTRPVEGAPAPLARQKVGLELLDQLRFSIFFVRSVRWCLVQDSPHSLSPDSLVREVFRPKAPTSSSLLEAKATTTRRSTS